MAMADLWQRRFPSVPSQSFLGEQGGRSSCYVMQGKEMSSALLWGFGKECSYFIDCLGQFFLTSFITVPIGRMLKVEGIAVNIS